MMAGNMQFVPTACYLCNRVAFLLLWSVLTLLQLNLASAQSLSIQPASAFTITFPSPYMANATSVGSSSTMLPAFLTINNQCNSCTPDEATLNATIVAGSPGATVSGLAFMYYFSGTAVQDTLDGSIPGPYVNGPIINVSNFATLTLNSPAGQALNSAILAQSYGANGYAQQKDGAQTAIYNAGFGGSATIAHSGLITVNGIANNASLGLLWSPFLSAIEAYSGGGTGAGAKADDNDFAGNGGNGGPINVTTAAGSAITLQGSGFAGNTINGITAYSQGGNPGSLTTGDHPNIFGASGSGGAIMIDHAGQISGSAGNSIGIVAASIGGLGGTLPGSGVGDSGGGTSGPGGAINVTVETNASINLSGANSIGIFAISAVGSSNNDYATLADISGGPVTVNVDTGANITTGNAGTGAIGTGRFAIGVLAVSSGTANILAPFDDSGFAIGGSGYSGLVTVNNAGTINSSGQMAIGIAALSVGGAGIVSNASYGSLSSLGSNAANQYAQGGSVTVTNSGSITTNGASAFGIVALSAGGGGLASADAGPTPGTPNINNGFNGGLVVGGTAGNSSPGGTVSVTNTGSVVTGDGQGGGKAAIGIIAQSIGGGGGSSGGTNPAAFIGDSAGGGGNGGAVSLTNNGTIVTNDDGALGILAQSIGGGGGNGGNAAGIFVAVGGAGGNGGTGGPVDVTLSGGLLSTSGDFAAGIIAQSVGGGGGNGGYGTSGGFFIDAAIGGTGGNGG